MMSSYIICYDIRCAKRLQKVHKIAVKYATPLQFSVFYGLMTKSTFVEMLAKLKKTIEPTKDDVRIYPVKSTTLAHWNKQGFSGDNQYLLLY
jgi:CRISPR-associated protein Cas2